MVLATRHDARAHNGDTALLVDLDLAVLGFEPELFDEYEHGVRAEYSWVDEDNFRLARATLLRDLLAQNPLYRTPQLRSRFETRARDNLARSLRAVPCAP